jgi:hypothetical protein
MQTKSLYWGDNESHEFWESEDHEWVILRNHRETCRTAHRFHRFVLAAPSAEAAVQRLDLTLCTDRAWTRTSSRKFRLEPQESERTPLL